MKKTMKKLISSFLMATLVGTLIMTNAAEEASAQSISPHTSALAVQDGASCHMLGPSEMASLAGSGWADWVLRLGDLACVSGSAAAVLRMTSPYVGAFCAGWAIGRYITG